MGAGVAAKRQAVWRGGGAACSGLDVGVGMVWWPLGTSQRDTGNVTRN